MKLSKHAAGEPLPTANPDWGYYGTLVKGGIPAVEVTGPRELLERVLRAQGADDEDITRAFQE